MRLGLRILIAVCVILPILGICAAALDTTLNAQWSGFPSSFLNSLLTDLALVLIYGFLPAIIGSLAHAQLTMQRRIADQPSPRLRSAAYGGAIGLATGFGLGLILCMLTATLVPLLLLVPPLWGAFGGVIYGLLAGPTPSPIERAV
jgi:hypothetical protein